MVKPNTKTVLHFAYLVGITLKGVDGLLEICGGAILLLTSRPAIVRAIASLTRAELYEDPHDFVATHALHLAGNLSPGTQHFASAYLLVHGAIKVGLVAGLVRRWRSAYPIALLLLTAFIGYQCFRLFRYRSPVLAIFTGIDIIIVLLISYEWRRVEGKRP
ncbi:MAG: DUF2127 domain-containing protein [Xanthomonadaceae bacterium]|nr:DUF2127 domain-containing protein [Xanthomonadaceae bacterium]